MAWQGILGHDPLVEHFRRLVRGRLASSFLFVGPEGIGKRTFAIKLAQSLLCPARPDEALDPCGTCPECTQVMVQTHPDLELVSRPKDKAFLPLELLIGDKEHRMRRGLCHRLSLKPLPGGRKVAVIDDTDYLNPEGANALLKTLEEPPPRSVLILVGTSAAKQLPTIRSRCQLIRFRALSSDDVATLLIERQLAADRTQALQLAEHAEGSLEKASELADPDLWAFRNLLYERLAQPQLDSVRLAKAASAFVNEAGKEAAARRRRMGQIVGLTAQFYRRQLRGLGPADASHPLLAAEVAAACLEQCLDTAEQIERNANQTTCLEAWLDGLAGRVAAN